MKEYFSCLLNSKVKLGYLHPVVKKVKNLTVTDDKVNFERKFEELTVLLFHFADSLKNNELCQKMDNSRDFLKLVVTFEEDLKDKIRKIQDVNSTSDHKSIIDTCKTIMKAWLQLILMWEKVQTKEINTLASKVKENLVIALNAKNPEELVHNFQKLCDSILTFKVSASVYANQLFDSNPGKLLMLFENIARLLNTLSKTAELKFKYQGVADDPKYLKYGKYCCDSIMFFVLEVTSVFKIPNANKCPIPNSEETIPSFIDLIDKIEEEISRRNENPNMEKLAEHLIALHWFCHKMVPLCGPVLNQRIMQSMERLLDLQESAEKLEDCIESISDELETLEKLVNMAILRILFEYSVMSYKKENIIMKNIILKVKENADTNLSQFQTEFKQQFKELREFMSHLCLVMRIILNCSSFIAAKWWISICLRRLVFVNEALLSCLEDYVAAPSNPATIHQLNIVKPEFDLILKITLNNVFTLIDTAEMLKFIDNSIKITTGVIEDEMEDEATQFLANVRLVTISAKIALRVVEAFSMTKMGYNGRKALKLASNQVICSIKTVSLYKSTYIADPKDSEMKMNMLLYLNNLGKEIEKLLSLCIDVKSSDMYNTETNSDIDDEVKEELQFGISDIVNELSVELSVEELVEKNSFSSALEFVCSIMSQTDVNDSESKIFSNLSLDFVHELSKLSVSDLRKSQKKLIQQAKELSLEIDGFTGSALFLSITKEITHFVLQIISSDREEIETKSIVKNLNSAICETTNMRVLFELSTLLRHFEIITKEVQSFHTAKDDVEISCDMNNIILKSTNLLKQLILMIDAALASKILVNTKGSQRSFKRSFRSLGFSTSVGLFTDELLNEDV